jgi:hypothetical protein
MNRIISAVGMRIAQLMMIGSDVLSSDCLGGDVDGVGSVKKKSIGM